MSHAQGRQAGRGHPGMAWDALHGGALKAGRLNLKLQESEESKDGAEQSQKGLVLWPFIKNKKGSVTEDQPEMQL